LVIKGASAVEQLSAVIQQKSNRNISCSGAEVEVRI
jgi:hypothetical protein